jgi:hypothetical protein
MARSLHLIATSATWRWTCEVAPNRSARGQSARRVSQNVCRVAADSEGALHATARVPIAIGTV